MFYREEAAASRPPIPHPWSIYRRDSPLPPTPPPPSIITRPALKGIIIITIIIITIIIVIVLLFLLLFGRYQYTVEQRPLPTFSTSPLSDVSELRRAPVNGLSSGFPPIVVCLSHNPLQFLAWQCYFGSASVISFTHAMTCPCFLGFVTIIMDLF